jgi:hypothetical protein
VIAIGADRFRSRAAASPELGAGSGGNVDDISKRMGEVEKAVVEVRTKLDTALPHLATKADVQAVRSDMHAMETRLVTKIEAMGTKIEGVAVQIVSAENRTMKWMIATLLSSVGLAAGVASAISHFVR